MLERQEITQLILMTHFALSSSDHALIEASLWRYYGRVSGSFAC